MKKYLYEDRIGYVEIVDFMGDDLTVVNSARVSFNKHKKSFDKEDERLVRYLLKNKHTSTLEHNVVTFRIKVPLFVRSQHHRHRTWSYNEISRRYTSVNMEFYEPSSFRIQSTSNRQASTDTSIEPIIEMLDLNIYGTASDVVKEHHRRSLEIYNQLIEQRVCREQARGILPQNLYTTYYATANLNNILKFLELRKHKGSQKEMQALALNMELLLFLVFPKLMNIYNLRNQ